MTVVGVGWFSWGQARASSRRGLRYVCMFRKCRWVGLVWPIHFWLVESLVPPAVDSYAHRPWLRRYQPSTLLKLLVGTRFFGCFIFAFAGEHCVRQTLVPPLSLLVFCGWRPSQGAPIVFADTNAGFFGFDPTGAACAAECVVL